MSVFKGAAVAICTPFLANGEVDYDKFTQFLPKLGAALRVYAEELNKEGWTSFDPSTGEKAISAAQALAGLAKDLPDTGGLVQKIMGEKHLDTFADDIKAIGEGLGSFASSVSGVEVGDAENAVSVMGIIQEFINTMDPEGGLFKSIGDFFSGNTTNSLLTLTANMKTVGENLNAFSTSITGADFSNLDAVKKVVTDMRLFINELDPEGGLWKDIGNLFGGSKDITHISSKMNTFGVDFASFSSGISGAAEASANFDIVRKIIDSFAELGAKLNSGEMDWDDVWAAGVALSNYCADGFVQGLADRGTDTKTAAENMAIGASVFDEKVTTSYYNMGTALGVGLGNGIAAMAAYVKSRAQSVAQGALNTIRISWSVHSPSREAAELGEFFDLGLARGLADYSKKVNDTVNSVADGALESAREAFLKGTDGSIFDYIDPNPAIRPVLDMTDIEAGLNGLDSSLTKTRAFGLFSGSFFRDTADSLMTNENGRLGGSDNSDVVGEIQTLEELIADMNDQLENMQIVLDTGALVGQTTSAYDHSLGRRVGYSMRGMKT